MSSGTHFVLIFSVMQFDALVAALPLSGEEAQLQRIAELQVMP